MAGGDPAAFAKSGSAKSVRLHRRDGHFADGKAFADPGAAGVRAAVGSQTSEGEIQPEIASADAGATGISYRCQKEIDCKAGRIAMERRFWPS
jgi:hypothetical protein